MAYDKLGRVLFVDDDEGILRAVRLFLKQYVAYIETLKDPSDIPMLLKREKFDVIFLDMNFTKGLTDGDEGFNWLKNILDADPNTIVIPVTAYGYVDKAVRAIKAGAFDYLLKPWENEKLLATLSAALKLQESTAELTSLRARERILSNDLDRPFTEIIGKSDKMRQVFDTITLVGPTDANVLLLGENGTGKELVARAIHRTSKRAAKPFIAVDMGAIAENLFESELFGHVKGAFTDAKDSRQGRFEIASSGTLFLDEIGNLSPQLQVKLLTTLERREFVRVGSNLPQSIDIRLICATNLPLREIVVEKKFRQDLFYRINTVEIYLPPLRDRIEDIPILVEHFVKVYGRKYQRADIHFSEAAIREMQRYHWPGNVRELQHFVERVVILNKTGILEPKDLSLDRNMFAEENPGASNNLEVLEKNVIVHVISKHQGNLSETAKELGVTRPALYRKIKKYKL